jgi:hypothetical protein
MLNSCCIPFNLFAFGFVVQQGFHFSSVHGLTFNQTFDEALKKGLKVVDSTAFSLCMDNRMPMRIFGMEPTGNITQAILGAQIGTLVTN